MNASRKVLVVDDDPAVRKSIDRVLTGKGYAVITAENRRRGDAQAERGKIRPRLYRHPHARNERARGGRTGQGAQAVDPGGDHYRLRHRCRASPRQGRRRLELRAQTAVARDDRRQRPRRPGSAHARKCWPCRRLSKRPRPNRPPAAACSRTSFCSSPRPSSAWPTSSPCPFVGLGVMAVLASRAALKIDKVRDGRRDAEDTSRWCSPRRCFGLVYVVLFPFIGLATLLWLAGRAVVARTKD